MRCKSPDCRVTRAPDRLFCPGHVEIFDRVYDEIHPKIAARRKREESGEVAPVVVTYVTPKKENRGAVLRERILKALADGPLDSVALAAACSVTCTTRSFNRARRQLIVEGSIVSAGQNGRSHIYSLPPADAQEATTAEAA